MKKILILGLAFLFSNSAMASVCIMQTVSNANTITDQVYAVICDGNRASSSGKSVTLTLQKYLNDGYKIAGQSSTDAMILYTLVK